MSVDTRGVISVHSTDKNLCSIVDQSNMSSVIIISNQIVVPPQRIEGLDEIVCFKKKHAGRKNTKLLPCVCNDDCQEENVKIRKYVICDYCGAKFDRKSKLIRHFAIHIDLRKFNCLECNAKFNNARSLAKHGLLHSGSKPYKCKYCDIQFRDSSNLRKHELKHEGAPKRFECTQCDKKYFKKSSLDVHVRIHSKDVQHVCAQCPRAFYTKKDLKRHESVHDSAKQFECPTCHILFKRRDNFSRHTKNAHHEKIPIPTPEVVETPELTENYPTPVAEPNEAETRLKIIEANNNRESVIFKYVTNESNQYQSYSYPVGSKSPEAFTSYSEPTPDLVYQRSDYQEQQEHEQYDTYNKECPDEIPYIHKKVNYECLNRPKSPTQTLSDFDDVKASWCLYQLSAKTSQEMKQHYVNPCPRDSIELYRKILFPN